MSECRYITSPYLRITYNKEEKGWKLENLLTQQSMELSKKKAKVLEKWRNGGEVSGVEDEEIKLMIREGLIVSESEAWEGVKFQNVEIEINTNCNRRCIYCPVSIDHKTTQYMSMELFNEIIDKVERFKSIRYISLNHYNEPTLDKYFEERIERIRKTNLRLILHTNASNLDDEKIKILKNSGKLYKLYVNFPTLDKNTFEQMTGSKLYNKTIKNLDNAVNTGLPVELSIQGNNEELEANLQGIKEKYCNSLSTEITAWGTSDRAGLLNNKYYQNIHVKDQFLPGGCPHILYSLNIGVDGDIHICANDYYRKNVYGNIKDGEIDEIFKNTRAKQLLKNVFGGMEAPENFICRKCSIMQQSKVDKIFFEHRMINK